MTPTIITDYNNLPEEGIYIIGKISKTFLGRAIQFDMWLYQKFLLKRKHPRHSINHTDIMIDGMVWGAQADGFFPHSYKYIYGKDKKSPILLLFKLDLSNKQTKTLKSFLKDKEGTKYEFSNLFFHIWQLITGKWKGQTNDKRFYCIEATACALNELYTGFVEKPHQINPLDFLEICESKL